MIVHSGAVSSNTFYAVMLQAIIPRPIAWVLTRNPDDSYNVAPFSFYNGVSAEPPVLMISVGWKDEGVRKDTWTNILERNDFVVHVPPADMATEMVATSAPLAHGVSELEHAGLGTVPVDGEALPRLDGPRAAFFCTRREIVEVGEQALILGTVRKIWLDDGAARAEGGRVIVDPVALAPLTRLGGKWYGDLGRLFEMELPK